MKNKKMEFTPGQLVEVRNNRKGYERAKYVMHLERMETPHIAQSIADGKIRAYNFCRHPKQEERTPVKYTNVRERLNKLEAQVELLTKKIADQ